MMDRACDELFAGAALSLNQYCATDRSHLLDLHEYLPDGIRMPHEPCRLGEPVLIQRTLDRCKEIIRRDGLGIHVDEADLPQPLDQLWIGHVRESHDTDAIPELIAHQLQNRGIGQVPRQHDQLRPSPTHFCPNVVERRDHDGADIGRLQLGV